MPLSVSPDCTVYDAGVAVVLVVASTPSATVSPRVTTAASLRTFVLETVAISRLTLAPTLLPLEMPSVLREVPSVRLVLELEPEVALEVVLI